MTLKEFKFIYHMEYGHRMLGRFLGVAFLGPLAFFAARKRIPLSLGKRLAGLGVLGAAQVCILLAQDAEE